MSRDRARLTPVDIAHVGVGVFVLGMLAAPIYTLLDVNSALIGTGDAYLARMVIPGALIGVMVIVMAIAVQGRGA